MVRKTIIVRHNGKAVRISNPSASKRHHHKSMNLLRLPVELRHQIFELVVRRDDLIDLRKARPPRLALVNRQLFAEATQCFFKVNRFTMRVYLDFETMFRRRARSPARRDMEREAREEERLRMKYLFNTMRMPEGQMWLRMVQKHVKLRHIEFEVITSAAGDGELSCYTTNDRFIIKRNDNTKEVGIKTTSGVIRGYQSAPTIDAALMSLDSAVGEEQALLRVLRRLSVITKCISARQDSDGVGLMDVEAMVEAFTIGYVDRRPT